MAKQLRKVAGGVEVDKRYDAQKVKANPPRDVEIKYKYQYIMFCTSAGFKKYKQLKNNFHKKPQIIIPVEKLLSKRQRRMRSGK